MMNCILKTRDFVLETRNCALKTRNCVFKMMNCAGMERSAFSQVSEIAQQLSDETPINHYRLLADVRDTLDHNAIMTEDGELTMASREADHALERRARPLRCRHNRLHGNRVSVRGWCGLACPEKQVRVAILLATIVHVL